MLKIKYAEETADTNPFVQIWTERAIAAPSGQRLESQSLTGYIFMMAVSGLTCFLALVLSGYGLYQIARPALSLAEGLSLATVGGVIMVGSSAALQLLGARVANILRQRRTGGDDQAGEADA